MISDLLSYLGGWTGAPLIISIISIVQVNHQSDSLEVLGLGHEETVSTCIALTTTTSYLFIFPATLQRAALCTVQQPNVHATPLTAYAEVLQV